MEAIETKAPIASGKECQLDIVPVRLYTKAILDFANTK